MEGMTLRERNGGEMTTATDRRTRTAALRRAAVKATLAPSVHNTQPWRFDLSPDGLDVFADPSRQLRALDPTGRQLIISCGSAVFNARVSLAAAGLDARVERLPDPAHANLLARITAVDRLGGQVDSISFLEPAIELRQTNRRQFSDDKVPVELLDSLVAAASAEHSDLLVVAREDDRLALTVLSQRADAIQNTDPAYRAELRAWTTDDDNRTDGVPVQAVPHVDGSAHDEIPIRDFDGLGSGSLPAETHSSHRQCLLLLGSSGDGPADWLRAGEALERVLLEITRRGFAASPLTQVVEVPSTRAALRNALGLTMYPHVLLRVGRAPLTPSTRRRRLVDVLMERP
jgi:hypothetical protein